MSTTTDGVITSGSGTENNGNPGAANGQAVGVMLGQTAVVASVAQTTSGQAAVVVGTTQSGSSATAGLAITSASGASVSAHSSAVTSTVASTMSGASTSAAATTSLGRGIAATSSSLSLTGGLSLTAQAGLDLGARRPQQTATLTIGANGETATQRVVFNPFSAIQELAQKFLADLQAVEKKATEQASLAEETTEQAEDQNDQQEAVTTAQDLTSEHKENKESADQHFAGVLAAAKKIAQFGVTLGTEQKDTIEQMGRELFYNFNTIQVGEHFKEVYVLVDKFFTELQGLAQRGMKRKTTVTTQIDTQFSMLCRISNGIAQWSLNVQSNNSGSSFTYPGCLIPLKKWSELPQNRVSPAVPDSTQSGGRSPELRVTTLHAEEDLKGEGDVEPLAQSVYLTDFKEAAEALLKGIHQDPWVKKKLYEFIRRNCVALGIEFGNSQPPSPTWLDSPGIIVSNSASDQVAETEKPVAYEMVLTRIHSALITALSEHCNSAQLKDNFHDEIEKAEQARRALKAHNRRAATQTPSLGTQTELQLLSTEQHKLNLRDMRAARAGEVAVVRKNPQHLAFLTVVVTPAMCIGRLKKMDKKEAADFLTALQGWLKSFQVIQTQLKDMESVQISPSDTTVTITEAQAFDFKTEFTDLLQDFERFVKDMGEKVHVFTSAVDLSSNPPSKGVTPSTTHQGNLWHQRLQGSQRLQAMSPNLHGRRLSQVSSGGPAAQLAVPGASRRAGSITASPSFSSIANTAAQQQTGQATATSSLGTAVRVEHKRSASSGSGGSDDSSGSLVSGRVSQLSSPQHVAQPAGSASSAPVSASPSVDNLDLSRTAGTAAAESIASTPSSGVLVSADDAAEMPQEALPPAANTSAIRGSSAARSVTITAAQPGTTSSNTTQTSGRSNSASVSPVGDSLTISAVLGSYVHVRSPSNTAAGNTSSSSGNISSNTVASVTSTIGTSAGSTLATSGASTSFAPANSSSVTSVSAQSVASTSVVAVNVSTSPSNAISNASGVTSTMSPISAGDGSGTSAASNSGLRASDSTVQFNLGGAAGSHSAIAGQASTSTALSGIMQFSSSSSTSVQSPNDSVSQNIGGSTTNVMFSAQSPSAVQQLQAGASVASTRAGNTGVSSSASLNQDSSSGNSAPR